MADVFLSYKREDRDRAKEIAGAVEQHGFSVFFDVEIDVGDSWDARIERELADARCVVVLWSGRSQNSRWVRNEARDGQNRTILAPVIIGDCRIPVEFSDVQAVDLQTWRGDPAAPEWKRLITRITACVQKPARKLSAKPWRRLWVRTVSAAAVAGAAIFGSFVYFSDYIDLISREPTVEFPRPNPEAVQASMRTDRLSCLKGDSNCRVYNIERVSPATVSFTWPNSQTEGPPTNYFFAEIRPQHGGEIELGSAKLEIERSTEPYLPEMVDYWPNCRGDITSEIEGPQHVVLRSWLSTNKGQQCHVSWRITAREIVLQ